MTNFHLSGNIQTTPNVNLLMNQKNHKKKIETTIYLQ